jgi:hypothetical protein
MRRRVPPLRLVVTFLAALGAAMLLSLPLSSAAHAQVRHLCQGRVCWPEGARPTWLDRAYATFDGMEAPVVDGVRFRARATFFAPDGLDPATCTLTATWRGARRGVRGARERIEGEASSGAPAQLAPGEHGVLATYVLDAPLPGAQLALETFANIACGGVSFSLSSTDNVVTTNDVLPLICALRPPRRTPAAVEVRLPATVRSVRVGARFGVVLRSRGRVLVDACSRRDLLDLSTLGVPITSVGVPPLGTLTPRDRTLALWGVEYAADTGSGVVRSFHGFNGDWLGFTLGRTATPPELARIRSIVAAVRALAVVDTMDDAPNPGDPPGP